MTPLTTNPTVVLLIPRADGNVTAVATNVALNLNVKIVTTEAELKAAGMPFNYNPATVVLEPAYEPAVLDYDRADYLA
jgi:hypothetical protein